MMDHKLNIGFVDTHPKCNGGRDYVNVVLHPLGLNLSFLGLGDVGMIECSFEIPTL
jgi:hypothetical protein